MRLLVLGKRGNIGKALHDLLAAGALPNWDAACLGSSDINLLDCNLSAALDQRCPDVVINAAAYTNVAGAETNFAEAMRLNADVPGDLAGWCARNKKLLVHYSTDYVYDGRGEDWWHEDDPAQPLNCYGASKLQGDQRIQQSGCRHFIFRVSWIYSPHGSNFVTTMLRFGKERDTLQVVNDQVGSPTLGCDVARSTLHVLEQLADARSVPSGVYHMTNEGFVSWHGFALAIFAEARARGWPLRVQQIVPVSSEQFGGPVVRPKNGRLSKQKLWDAFQLRLPPWEDALGRCFDSLVGMPAEQQA